MNFADRVKKSIKKKIEKVLKEFGVKTKEEALSEASIGGNINIVKFLIDNGADVNVKNKYGWTSLINASFEGNKEIAKLLIDNGANINTKDNSGWTALITASRFKHKDIVELLKEHGAKE